MAQPDPFISEEAPAQSFEPAADPFSNKIEATPPPEIKEEVIEQPKDKLESRERKLFDLSNLKSGDKKLANDFSIG